MDGTDAFVLLVHCHEMLPWRVHILTKQLLISKATAQQHLHLDILLSNTFYLDEIPWAKTCIIMDKMTFPERGVQR